jgi:hypothetical protein
MALVIERLNMAVKGSYRLRKQMLEAMAGIGSENVFDQARGMLVAGELLRARLHTDDGSPVEEALDELSADGFDELLKELMASPVPKASAVS